MHRTLYSTILVALLFTSNTSYALDIVLPANVSEHTLDIHTTEDVNISFSTSARLKGILHSDGVIRISGATATDCTLDPSLEISGFTQPHPQRLDMQFGFGLINIETPITVSGDNGVGMIIRGRNVRIQRDINTVGFTQIGTQGLLTDEFVTIGSGVQISVDGFFQSEAYFAQFQLLPNAKITSEVGLQIRADAGLLLQGDIETNGNTTLLSTGNIQFSGDITSSGLGSHLIRANEILINSSSQQFYGGELNLSPTTTVTNFGGTINADGDINLSSGSINCFGGSIIGANGEQC